MCLCTRVREDIAELYRVHTAKTGKVLCTTYVNTYAPVTSDDGADQWQFWGSDFSAFAQGSLTTAISCKNFMKFQLITTLSVRIFPTTKTKSEDASHNEIAPIYYTCRHC